MNAKQKLHQAHLNEWAARFADQKSSGLTVKQWCEQNHFSIHTYNYWKHLFKEEIVDAVLPDIVPIPLSAQHTDDLTLGSNNLCTIPANRSIRSNCTIAKLTIGDVSIEINTSVPEEFLCTLIKAVRHA